MKKYLVLLLSLAMVFSMAAVSMAAITINGDTTLTHDFNKDGNASSKIGDINLYFKNQVSESVNWTLRFDTTDKTGTAGYYYPWIREAYTDIKLGGGNLKFGLFEVKPYSSIGILADNGDSAIGRLKDPFTIGYTTPQFGPGLTGSLYYFIDGSNTASDYDTKQIFDDGAWVANLAYKGEKLFVDFYLVESSINNYEMGYALNAKYKVLDPLTLGLNYGKSPEADNAQKEMQIVELQYEQGPVYAKFGYDLNDGADAKVPGMNRNAYSVGYKMKNGITTEWRSKNLDKGKDSQELRVIFKW